MTDPGTQSRQPRVALVQDGARGHYGLALALQRAGILERMYTDQFIRKGSLAAAMVPLMRKVAPGAFRRMLERRNDELDDRRIRMNLALRIRQESRRKSFPDSQAFFEWQSADVAKWITKIGFGGANALMGFIRNIDPTLCRHARSLGLKTVGDQMIAPALIEQREFQLQRERFPGWHAGGEDDFQRVIDYEQATWRELDAITCPSEYVRDGVVSCGVSAEKAHVVNYPVDEHAFTFVDRSGRQGKTLTVGFVGAIGLRKGAGYFLEVARRFPAEQVRFVMVGSTQLSRAGITALKSRVDVVGNVPRNEVSAWLNRFDLIYFPTTVEGSAYALMEAMATGLPIVTAPSSGTVARHGQEGFICAYDDLDSATTYIERLVREEELRLTMGKAAAARYRQFNMDNYSRLLGELFARLLKDG